MVKRQCEECDLNIEGENLMTVIQRPKRHKEVCMCKIVAKYEVTDDECEDCDKKYDNSKELKRHKRDNHNIRTISTSPKGKKKRESKMKDSEEDMIITYDDSFRAETRQVLQMPEVASWEEDRMDNEKMDFKTIKSEPKDKKKRKRLEEDSSKNVKRIMKNNIHIETNRKEMAKKRKESKYDMGKVNRNEDNKKETIVELVTHDSTEKT